MLERVHIFRKYDIYNHGSHTIWYVILQREGVRDKESARESESGNEGKSKHEKEGEREGERERESARGNVRE